MAGGPIGWFLVLLPLELLVLLVWLGAKGPGDPRWRLVIQSLICGLQAAVLGSGASLVLAVLIRFLPWPIGPAILLVLLAPVAVVAFMNAAFIARMRGVNWFAALAAEDV